MKYSQSFHKAISLLLSQSGVCQFTSLNFPIIHDQFPWCLPSGKATPGMTLDSFWKSYIFPGELSSSHWGTETGCLYKLFDFIKVHSIMSTKTFYKFLALFMVATHLAFTILRARMTRRLCRFHNSLHETLWTTKVISFFATNQSFDQQLFRDAMMF